MRRGGVDRSEILISGAATQERIMDLALRTARLLSGCGVSLAGTHLYPRHFSTMNNERWIRFIIHHLGCSGSRSQLLYSVREWEREIPPLLFPERTSLVRPLAEPFLRPGRFIQTPTRAVAVKAGRFFSGHRRLGLDGREHDGTLARSGARLATVVAGDHQMPRTQPHQKA